MLAHFFDRFYVVTKFTLPSVNDLKFLPIDFNEQSNYLNEDFRHHHNSKEYISNLKIYCKKIVPFIHFYKELIPSDNCTVHNILMNENIFDITKFPKRQRRKEKYNCFTTNRIHRLSV